VRDGKIPLFGEKMPLLGGKRPLLCDGTEKPPKRLIIQRNFKRRRAKRRQTPLLFAESAVNFPVPAQEQRAAPEPPFSAARAAQRLSARAGFPA
jgi:hypothetical protein